MIASVIIRLICVTQYLYKEMRLGTRLFWRYINLAQSVLFINH